MNMVIDSRMSAKAVFNVWSTEPDTLKILDVRSPEDFNFSHIPTSERIELDEAVNFILKQDNNILYVIIAKPDFVSEELSAISNVVIVDGGFTAWRDSKFPIVAGNDSINTNFNTKLISKQGDNK